MRFEEEMVGIRGHLGNCEMQYGGNSMKSVKVTLVRTPSNAGHRAGHLLQLDKAPSGVSELHSVKLLAKGVQWGFPNNLVRGLLSAN